VASSENPSSVPVGAGIVILAVGLKAKLVMFYAMSVCVVQASSRNEFEEGVGRKRWSSE
jgi:hypothetical protein